MPASYFDNDYVVIAYFSKKIQLKPDFDLILYICGLQCHWSTYLSHIISSYTMDSKKQDGDKKNWKIKVYITSQKWENVPLWPELL